MIGPIASARVANEIANIFGGASEAVRSAAGRSIGAERQGERARREESYTDALIDDMKTTIAARVQASIQTLAQDQGRLDVRFEPVNLPVAEESAYGADIGIRVEIRTRNFTIVKGLLVQCKRMHGPESNPTFPEIRGRGEEQAKNMLRITPASVFMLFNFGKNEHLLGAAGIPPGFVCPGGGIRGLDEKELIQFVEECPGWRDGHANAWDLGIAIVPATRIFGLSAKAKERIAPFPVDVPEILRGAIPFGLFMSSFLASCFVGDVRADVVNLVTAPGARVDFSAQTGLVIGYGGFRIRQHMNVILSVGE